MGWSHSTIGFIFYREKTFCFVGDGALMMCLNELATIQKHKIPIVLIINNKGYSMIRQTQKQWFKSDFFASSKKKQKINISNFKFLKKNIDYKKISSLKKIEQKILKDPKPLIVDIDIHENADVPPS